jgi:hypothetical protein
VQLLTLLGVGVGALASFVSTRLVDRSRWQREEAVRWEMKRLECYSEFSSSISHFTNIANRISAGLNLPANVQPVDTDTTLADMAAAEAELSVKWEQMLMLGSPEAITAAQEWRHEAWQLESFARGSRSDPAEFLKATQDRREARRRFYTAARADLGVLSGDIPTTVDRRPAWMRQTHEPSDP